MYDSYKLDGTIVATHPSLMYLKSFIPRGVSYVAPVWRALLVFQLDQLTRTCIPGDPTHVPTYMYVVA